MLLKAAISSLSLSLLVWASTPAQALTCGAKTECKAACARLSETLTCSKNGKRCTMGCGERREKAECTSGSGTRCRAYCESGTIAATCTKRAARCTGRCTPARGSRAFFSHDLPIPPALAYRPQAALRTLRAHHRSRPGPPERPSDETLVVVFSGLATDVWWSVGGSGSASPSSLTEELLATLRADRDFAATGVYEGPLAGDEATIKLGLSAAELARMLRLAEDLIETFQDPTARQQYDASVRQSIESEL